MLPDWYVRFSEASGPAFVAQWSNADVAIVSLLIFTVGFALAAALTAHWLFDVAFAALVAGGILVTWPAMIALTIAAVFVAIVIGRPAPMARPRAPGAHRRRGGSDRGFRRGRLRA